MKRTAAVPSSGGVRYIYQYTGQAGYCSPPIPPPEHGFSYFHATHLGAVVVHKCKPGYKLVGASLRVCKQDRQWYPKAPICTCKYIYLHVNVINKNLILMGIIYM